jgi:hypothetical protein
MSDKREHEPGDIIINTELFTRMRQARASAGAVGLYVLMCQRAAQDGSNGRVPGAAVDNIMGDAPEERTEALPFLHELMAAAFVAYSRKRNELIIVDWGEWVMGHGEAGSEPERG